MFNVSSVGLPVVYIRQLLFHSIVLVLYHVKTFAIYHLRIGSLEKFPLPLGAWDGLLFYCGTPSAFHMIILDHLRARKIFI